MFPQRVPPIQALPSKNDEGGIITPVSQQSDLRTYHRVVAYSHPCIILPHDIEPETLTNFIEAVHTCPDPDKIVVYCNGWGGDGHTALGIVDFMDSLKNRILFIGVVSGGSYSASSIIFAGCQKRYIGRNSLLGIHGVQNGAWGTQKDIYNGLTQSKFFNDRVSSIYANASNQNKKEWKKILLQNGNMCATFSAKKLVEKLKMAEYYDQGLF